MTVLYSKAVVELRTVFLDAKSIDLDKASLKVEGVPVVTLEDLNEVCRVLTKLWGDEAKVSIEHRQGMLRIRRSAGSPAT